MTKGAAITKRLKIDKAQEAMYVGVFVASLIVGTAIVLIIYFSRYIAFNAKVIGAKNDAIDAYSDVIKNTGTCKEPKGKIYTDEELAQCSPNDVDVNDVVGSLRNNVLVEMASNTNLESVARDSLSVCLNPNTNEKYTYKELDKMYDEASNDEERSYYLGMVKLCSALRVVSDALPTLENEEALMSSLNQIFILSNWTPESLSPGSGSSETEISGLYSMPVNLSVDADGSTTLKVLSNIEKSIRDFSITSASIEWSGELNGLARLNLTADATAYFIDPVKFEETPKTVYASEKKGALKNEE